MDPNFPRDFYIREIGDLLDRYVRDPSEAWTPDSKQNAIQIILGIMEILHHFAARHSRPNTRHAEMVLDVTGDLVRQFSHEVADLRPDIPTSIEPDSDTAPSQSIGQFDDV
jgi:hypothetical protein